MISLDLRPTQRLHARLQSVVPARGGAIASAIESANQAIRGRGITFGGEKEMPIALSALILSESDVEQLSEGAGMLWGILEQLVDWIVSDEDRLRRFGGDHTRIAPWLRKTVGSTTWQLFSRYDAVVSEAGRVRFIECNTGCPAGFLHGVDFTEETQRALGQLDVLTEQPISRLGMIRRESLPDLLLSAERRRGAKRGLIGILTDENNLKLELDLLERELKVRGRQARVIDARRLRYSNGRLCDGEDEITSAFLKVRISTPDSPNHCWKRGFEERYAGLLGAIADDAVAVVNNLCALSVAEDKGMLANLFVPEIRERLSATERTFVDDCLVWTARLEPGRVSYRGETVDLLEHVRDMKDSFVLKPANEGRGFEVHVGKNTSQEDWERVCRPSRTLPMVVQEYIEPCRLPVACLRPTGVEVESMYLTIALAMVDGRYEGILSRISPNVVTNVGRQGFVQAVFVS